MTAPLPLSDVASVAARQQYALLASVPAAAFAELVQLAAQIFEAPMAQITLVDNDRAWCKSNDDWSAGDAARDAGFCAHVLLAPNGLFVSDTIQDVRFATAVLASAEPHIRFYAAVPLITPQGHALGILCVMDRVAHAINEGHRHALRVLGRQVMAQLELGQRAAELAVLRESEAHYRTVVEQAADGIFMVDPAGRYVDVNASGHKLLGYDHGELVGLTIADVMIESERPCVPVEYRAILAGEPHLASWQFRRKDGVTMFGEVNARRLADGHMVAIVRDQTERLRAEVALREREERFATAFRSSPAAIAINRQTDFVNLEVNETFLRLFECTREEIIGRSLQELGWLDAKTDAILRQRIKASGTLNMDLRVQTRTGKPLDIDVAIKVIQVAGETCALSVLVDKTERKHAEEELRISHAQLRALAARLQTVREDQSTHIAREIHDVLGQQLTALKLDVAWLKRRVTAVDETALKASLLEKLKATSQALDASIDTVQKIATELRPGTLEKLGLAAALEHEVREFGGRTGIRCATDFPPEPRELSGEQATGIFRVAQEILTNVARHAHATSVHARLAVEEGEVVLEVSDNGGGIADNQINEMKSLGLLGMRERAHLLGGKLLIRGIIGTGTTVTLTVPLPPHEVSHRR